MPTLAGMWMDLHRFKLPKCFPQSSLAALRRAHSVSHFRYDALEHTELTLLLNLL